MMMDDILQNIKQIGKDSENKGISDLVNGYLHTELLIAYAVPGIIQALKIVKEESMREQAYSLLKGFDPSVVEIYALIIPQ